MFASNSSKRNREFLKVWTSGSVLRVSLPQQRKKFVKFHQQPHYLAFLLLSAACQFCYEMYHHETDRNSEIYSHMAEYWKFFSKGYFVTYCVVLKQAASCIGDLINIIELIYYLAKKIRCVECFPNLWWLFTFKNRVPRNCKLFYKGKSKAEMAINLAVAQWNCHSEEIYVK